MSSSAPFGLAYKACPSGAVLWTAWHSDLSPADVELHRKSLDIGAPLSPLVRLRKVPDMAHLEQVMQRCDPTGSLFSKLSDKAADLVGKMTDNLEKAGNKIKAGIQKAIDLSPAPTTLKKHANDALNKVEKTAKSQLKNAKNQVISTANDTGKELSTKAGAMQKMRVSNSDFDLNEVANSNAPWRKPVRTYVEDMDLKDFLCDSKVPKYYGIPVTVCGYSTFGKRYRRFLLGTSNEKHLPSFYVTSRKPIAKNAEELFGMQLKVHRAVDKCTYFALKPPYRKGEYLNDIVFSFYAVMEHEIKLPPLLRKKAAADKAAAEDCDHVSDAVTGGKM